MDPRDLQSPAGPNTTPQGDAYVLGVDGGGSKTVAWLARASQPDNPGGQPSTEVLGRGVAESSNLRAVGFTRGLERLTAAVDAARRDAGWNDGAVDAAVFGLAGSGNAEVVRVVHDWAQTGRIAERLEIVHDAQPVLAAAAEDWGIALISGTGSSAYAISQDGHYIAVIGGWGHLLGDEGSGFWIGQQALQRVCLAQDGRGRAPGLSAEIRTALAVDDAREMLSALSARGDLRQAIAQLAPLVLQCADAGDPDAHAVIDDAASHLAELVVAAAVRIGVARDYPLALTGGVLTGSATLRQLVEQKLHSATAEPATVEVVSDPVLGCVNMAARLISPKMPQ